MELKRHFDLRYLFVGIYIAVFVLYLALGLKPADAAKYIISDELVIPSIGLDADVTTLELHNGQLDTPDTIVGSYKRTENKTLLIGHSTTVFEHLADIQNGDTIVFGGNPYNVVAYETRLKEDISMLELLKSESRDTLVLMTCAGQLLGNGDATHRLIITATRD